MTTIAQQVKKYGKAVLKICFIFATAFAMMCDYFNLPWYTYLAYFAFFFGIAAFKILWTGDRADLHYIKWFAIAATLPYIVMLMFSLFIWYYTQQQMVYISRGVSRIAFQLLGIAFAFGICILFQKDALYLFLDGLILGNVLLVLKVITANGAGAFINAAVQQIVTGGETEIPIMRQLEIHDATFAIGLYILFFIIQHRRARHPLIYLIITGALFMIGFKRSAIASIILLTFVFFLLRIIVKGLYRVTIAVIGLAMAIVSMLYVVIIENHIFDYLVELLGVNTMGRMGLYDMFSDAYNMSITFTGYGMGWTTRLISTWYESGVLDHNFGALHNDILTMYLELGFIGFVVWLIAELYLKGRITGMFYGDRMEIIVFVLSLYTFITYFSDNTHFYPCVQTALYLIPMGFEFERRIFEGQYNHKRSELTADSNCRGSCKGSEALQPGKI